LADIQYVGTEKVRFMLMYDIAYQKITGILPSKGPRRMAYGY